MYSIDTLKVAMFIADKSVEFDTLSQILLTRCNQIDCVKMHSYYHMLFMTFVHSSESASPNNNNSAIDNSRTR